jgi:hypothetical protein
MKLALAVVLLLTPACISTRRVGITVFIVD